MNWLRAKFSRKLGFAFCATVGASLIFCGFLLTQALQTHLIQELTTGLTIQARGLTALLPEEAFRDRSLQWQSAVQRIGQATGARVSLIRSDGLVTADSHVHWDEIRRIENHSDRPEFRAALRDGAASDVRLSNTVGVEMLYIAVPYPAPEGALGCVRLALPLDGVRQKISNFRRIVLGSVAGAVLIGWALAMIIAHRLTAPLDGITQAARSISEGDLERRVSTRSEDEIGQLATAFNRMVERLQDSLLEIERERDEIAAILSNMVEHVVAMDRSGKIFLMNPAAGRLFGCDSPEALGKPFLEVVRQAAIGDLLRSALDSGQESSHEIRLFLPAERVFEARALPIRRGDQVLGALLVMHDITRIQQLEQIRKEFVANVSHELRTPLTSIQGFAETLLSGAIDDPNHNREFVETIHQQAERLTRLVNELLDLSAIESGRKKPELSIVALPALVREAEAAMRPLAQKMRVSLDVRIPEGLSAVRADRDQLKQVLLNLLDNAVKFSREGGFVTVSAETNGGSVTLSVQDTGIGIPAEDLPRIFERFYRVDKARSRDLGGTGLGLAIVKHIVEANGGQVRVESVFGQGSTFLVTLPTDINPSA